MIKNHIITKLLLISSVLLLMAACYSSKEHREWDKREKYNLPDSYFFNVLKDTANKSKVTILYNYPYVHIGKDTFFHPFSFDKNASAYSDAWRKEKPNLATINDRLRFAGYYKIYGDTLLIETIASWAYWGKIPAKFAHSKKIGIISGDTIKLPRQGVDIDTKNKIPVLLDDYLPIEKKK